MKGEDKSPIAKLSEEEISNLPNREFKNMIIKMLNELSNEMDEHSEKFNNEKI